MTSKSAVQPRTGRCRNLPHDQGRQADRGHLQGRDHQYPLDVLRRRLHRRARQDGGDSASTPRERGRMRISPRSRPGSTGRPGSRTWWRSRQRGRTPRSACGSSMPGSRRSMTRASGIFVKKLTKLAETGKRSSTSAAHRDAPAGLRVLVRHDGRDGGRGRADRMARLGLRHAEGGLTSGAARRLPPHSLRTGPRAGSTADVFTCPRFSFPTNSATPPSDL